MNSKNLNNPKAPQACLPAGRENKKKEKKSVVRKPRQAGGV